MVQAHACLCIECAERLIEQDHGGLVDESPHNRHPLLHSSRKLGGIVVLESFKPDQAQPMQGLFAPLGRCDTADCQRKFNIAQSSQPWKQVAVLSHVADVGVQTKDWSTLVEDGTLRCSEQTRGETQQSGLAATGRTDDGCNPFWRNVKADAVKRKYVLLLTSKRKPNIRELYRGRFRIIGSVYQAAPAHRLSAVPYFQPLQLWSIAEGLSEKSRAQSHSLAQELVRPEFAFPTWNSGRNHLEVYGDLDVVFPHRCRHPTATRVTIARAFQGALGRFSRNVRR